MSCGTHLRIKHLWLVKDDDLRCESICFGSRFTTDNGAPGRVNVKYRNGDLVTEVLSHWIPVSYQIWEAPHICRTSGSLIKYDRSFKIKPFFCHHVETPQVGWFQ